MREVLTLADYRMYSEKPGEEGVASASYYVEATENEQNPRIYSLTVMTEQEYDAWFFAMSFEEPDEAEIGKEVAFPLCVPQAQLASDGLKGFVEGTYLNRNRPERINEIRCFLVGPLD